MLKVLRGQAFGRTIRDLLIKRNLRAVWIFHLFILILCCCLPGEDTVRRQHLGTRYQLLPGVISWYLDLGLL